MKSHKDLDVWKLSMELVYSIYTTTQGYPKEEVYGLTSQIRRSAISIPSNVAEGAARKGRNEFVQFLYIALGSCAELETQLLIAKNLGYLTDEEHFTQIRRIRFMLLGLIKKLRT